MENLKKFQEAFNKNYYKSSKYYSELRNKDNLFTIKDVEKCFVDYLKGQKKGT